MLHYILATHMCKFLYVCAASYTRVHASNFSMRDFVSAMCVSHTCSTHVDFVLHV